MMRNAPETQHSKFPHVYAIVRFDSCSSSSRIENGATVVKVFSSRELADQEADRLTRINYGKSCTYVVQTTRLIGALLKADG